MSDFVLDRADNPHPRMLSGALEARAAAFSGELEAAHWRGYLRAMADATGCEEEELLAWLDGHEAR